MDPIQAFVAERNERIAKNGEDHALKTASKNFLQESLRTKYSYNFSWMGRPVIQYPQDLMAMQEIIWQVQPDLIIETGIAHGGSLIFSASMLELIGNPGIVLGIDVDIRTHNRTVIEQHAMFKRIQMIEGSSIDEDIIGQVTKIVAEHQRILVVLDSNHTCEHVLEELRLYSPLVSPGSYMIVFDGVIEEMSEYIGDDRPWGPGNNPLTAIQQFLRTSLEFVVDHQIEKKLQLTAAPSGYLKCVRNV